MVGAWRRPIREVALEDLDETYIKVENWDPYFWEKVTHFSCESHWEGNEFCSHYEYYMKANEVWGKLDGGRGYVYILISDQQEGICKIGSTERTPEERLREINRATGVILPWKLYDAFPCRAPHSVEKIVHKVLAEARIDRRKEGFAVLPETAQGIISKVIESNSEEFKIKDEHKDNVS